MNDLNALTSGLENKVKQLIKLHKTTKNENVSLLNEKKELENLIENQKTIIKQLEEKINILKITKSFELVDEKEDINNKINQLVREINKCIAYLNT